MTPMPFRFERRHLAELAAAHHEEYVGARPFPHIVLDEFLPEPVLDAVLREFPSQEGEAWMRFQSDNERKLASREDTPMGDSTLHLLRELNSAPFIEFLERLTGITGLVPDPHFEGGGLHQITPGGHLNVHVDFNRHPRTGLERRLNVLIYLNRDWRPEYGGALELWDQGMERCERSILPVFNRLVAFSTTEDSYHGHPEPLNCPEGWTRKSLALYYYSLPRSRSLSSGGSHNTVWKRRPQDVPPEGGNDTRAGRRLKTAVRRLTPPVLLDIARAARARSRGHH